MVRTLLRSAAGCVPACPVVREGRSRDASSYPDPAMRVAGVVGLRRASGCFTGGTGLGDSCKSLINHARNPSPGKGGAIGRR